MTTARQHDDQLLGAHYTWSVAGAGDPGGRAAAWLARHHLADFARYLDLGAGFGAGFGAHAVRSPAPARPSPPSTSTPTSSPSSLPPPPPSRRIKPTSSPGPPPPALRLDRELAEQGMLLQVLRAP